MRVVGLTTIALSSNQIADDGVAALASALRGGAMPACTKIDLDDNPGDDYQVLTDSDGDPLTLWSCPQVEGALASPERAAALARRQAK